MWNPSTGLKFAFYLWYPFGATQERVLTCKDISIWFVPPIDPEVFICSEGFCRENPSPRFPRFLSDSEARRLCGSPWTPSPGAGCCLWRGSCTPRYLFWTERLPGKFGFWGRDGWGGMGRFSLGSQDGYGFIRFVRKGERHTGVISDQFS